MHTTARRIRQLGVALCWAALLPSHPSFADDAAANSLGDQDKQRVAELEKAKLLADKEREALTAQTELAKAKVAAATPATAAGVNGLSGTVTGANNMTFAMYLTSLEGLQRVAQAICNDLGGRGIKEVYVTGKDVSEAIAKDAAATRAREQLITKLRAVQTQADRMTAAIKGEAPDVKIEAASLTAVASGIDIAAGLVKGAAGLASLFKSERTVEGADNLLTAAEMSASLSMCSSASAPDLAAPQIRNVDSDTTTLTNLIGQIGNEVKQVSDLAAGLDAALTKLTTAAADLDKERAQATRAKDKAKLPVLEKRAPPVNYAAFGNKAAALVTQAQAYVDAVYQVDSTSGLSPLIVFAQFRAVHDAQAANNRLVLSLLKSSGYTLTTKRLLLNDRVDYAGGLAVRACVVNSTGGMAYDRVFFRDSGWIRADFKPSGDSIQRQNF